MGDSAKEPLRQPEASLRFPGVNGGGGGDGSKASVSGRFDGNDSGVGRLFSYLTRMDSHEPPVPSPPASEVEAAKALGIDERTGRDTQPEWLSVLKKRAVPWMWLRCLTLNCCFQAQWTLTRAQWLWSLHLIGFLVHFLFACMVGAESMKQGKGVAMEATVWRLQPHWNASHPTDGYTASLVDNGMPLRVDLLVGGLFGVSAVVHLIPVAFGPFDRWVFLVWRQLDLCFHWWRYLDMAFSFPLLATLVCALAHLREESVIALVWMCMTSTVFFLFVIELWSRPHRNADKTYDMRRWLGDDPPVSIEGERPTPEEQGRISLRRARRAANYSIRMAPLGLAMVPFAGAWIVILNGFFTQLHALRITATDDLYARTPDFVPTVVLLTLFFQILHFFPLVWYEGVAPMHFWKTDALYTLLSLLSKVVIGQMLLEHVVRSASFNDAIALHAEGPVGATVLAAAVGNATL